MGSRYPWFFIIASQNPLKTTLFPYTTLFRSLELQQGRSLLHAVQDADWVMEAINEDLVDSLHSPVGVLHRVRSEEQTSELQSRRDFVCRLLLEKNYS